MIEDWLANAYEGMSRRQFLAAAGVAGTTLAGFAVAAKPVDGEIIRTSDTGLTTKESTVLSGDFQVPLYEAYPAEKGKNPVVIVIPEIFGMHEHIRDVVRRFARAGYLGITFEPYARDGGVLHISEITEVRKVADKVPDARVMADLSAIMDFVRKHPAADAGRIGVTGFCRGGLYTLLFAAQSKQVKAAVSWYGQIKPAKTPGIRTENPIDVAGRIEAPVLLLYGEADLGIPVADVKELEAALKAAGKKVELVLYPGAPHAFHADYRPSYRADAAADAWKRCLAWFDRYLKK